MSKSAFSLRVFSLYMLVVGVVLIADPNWLLALFGVPETHEVWIRIVGMLMLIIGFIDFMAAGNEVRLFSGGRFTPGWQCRYSSSVLLRWLLRHRLSS